MAPHSSAARQTGTVRGSLPSLLQSRTAQGPHALRSQVNRCPGFLESILFSCGPATLRLRRSAEGGGLLCDLIFSVNEACYEWKAFPAHHKSHRQFRGLSLLERFKVPPHQCWGAAGRGEAVGGDSLVFPDLITGLILTLHTTLRRLFSPTPTPTSLWSEFSFKQNKHLVQTIIIIMMKHKNQSPIIKMPAKSLVPRISGFQEWFCLDCSLPLQT